MSLSLTAHLELDPESISGEQSILLRYSVGSGKRSRACDRIVVGGEERAEREFYDVVGTMTGRQVEKRRLNVSPPADKDVVLIEVFVREVDQDNRPVGREKRATAVLRVDRP